MVMCVCVCVMLGESSSIGSWNPVCSNLVVKSSSSGKNESSNKIFSVLCEVCIRLLRSLESCLHTQMIEGYIIQIISDISAIFI